MQNSPQNFYKKLLGGAGENRVVKYLKKQGYKIIKRNYKTPFGEADILAEKDGVTCFIEVKTRTSETFSTPREAVTKQKQKRYYDIARYYIAYIGKEVPVRFDVAEVEDEIEYIENAF